MASSCVAGNIMGELEHRAEFLGRRKVLLQARDSRRVVLADILACNIVEAGGADRNNRLPGFPCAHRLNNKPVGIEQQGCDFYIILRGAQLNDFICFGVLCINNDKGHAIPHRIAQHQARGTGNINKRMVQGKVEGTGFCFVCRKNNKRLVGPLFKLKLRNARPHATDIAGKGGFEQVLSRTVQPL